MRFPRKTFQNLAERALAEVPKAFLKLLYNLEIDLKTTPGPEAGRWKGSTRLLGLYKGLSRDQMKSPISGSYLPSRIILYQRNIETRCESEEELARRVRLTLRHELAHHFGFSDAELRERWPEGA